MKIHNLDYVSIRIMKISAAPTERAVLTDFFFDYMDILVSKKRFHLVIPLTSIDKSSMNIVFVAPIWVDVIFRKRQHKIGSLAAHEDHVVITP